MAVVTSAHQLAIARQPRRSYSEISHHDHPLLQVPGHPWSRIARPQLGVTRAHPKSDRRCPQAFVDQNPASPGDSRFQGSAGGLDAEKHLQSAAKELWDHRSLPVGRGGVTVGAGGVTAGRVVVAFCVVADGKFFFISSSLSLCCEEVRSSKLLRVVKLRRQASREPPRLRRACQWSRD